MIDPEQMREERRDRKRSKATPTPSKSNGAVSESRLRDGEGPGRRWLCIVRGDKKPASIDELGAAIAAVAKLDDVTPADVESAIAEALEAEGKSLNQWREDLRHPRRFRTRATRRSIAL